MPQVSSLLCFSARWQHKNRRTLNQYRRWTAQSNPGSHNMTNGARTRIIFVIQRQSVSDTPTHNALCGGPRRWGRGEGRALHWGQRTPKSTGRIVMETNRGASDEDTRRPGRKRTSATRKDSGCEGSVVDEWVEQETRMDQTIEQRCEVLYGMPREGKKA